VNEYLLAARGKARHRVLVTSIVLTVVVGAVSYLVGVGWWQCLLLASAAAATGAVYLALTDLEADPALPPLDDSGRSTGTRRDVSRLSWVMEGHDNRVGAAPYRRLRAIATNRLALMGVDLADEDGRTAARALLGPVGYATLVEESLTTPTQRVFVDCVTLLEGLDLGRRVPQAASPASDTIVSTPTPRSPRS
jgi:hypothetical protein